MQFFISIFQTIKTLDTFSGLDRKNTPCAITARLDFKFIYILGVQLLHAIQIFSVGWGAMLIFI